MAEPRTCYLMRVHGIWDKDPNKPALFVAKLARRLNETFWGNTFYTYAPWDCVDNATRGQDVKLLIFPKGNEWPFKSLDMKSEHDLEKKDPDLFDRLRGFIEGYVAAEYPDRNNH